MERKVIKLSSQEDLKIFMSPQRQKLMKLLQQSGEPVTPKAISTEMGISPSSAQFHIKKLLTLGLVELDHMEIINGIQAKYYKAADVDVQIGSPIEEDLSKERYAIMQNLIKDSFDGLLNFYEKDLPDEQVVSNSDFLNGVIHLSEEDSRKLLKMIREFIVGHEKKEKGTKPWDYTIILYNTKIEGTKKNAKGEEK